MLRPAGTFGHIVTDEGFGHEVLRLENYSGCRVGNPSVSDSDQVGAFGMSVLEVDVSGL